MRYALLVSYDENAEISAGERARREAGFASVSKKLPAVGAFARAFRLQPVSMAVTVRCWDGGDVLVSPGPVTSAREQLAACFVVDCPDAAAAIEVATLIPAAWYGSVEVRPLAAEPGQPDAAVPSVPSQAVLAAAASLAGSLPTAWTGRSVADRELNDLDDDQDHGDA